MSRSDNTAHLLKAVADRRHAATHRTIAVMPCSTAPERPPPSPVSQTQPASHAAGSTNNPTSSPTSPGYETELRMLLQSRSRNAPPMSPYVNASTRQEPRSKDSEPRTQSSETSSLAPSANNEFAAERCDTDMSTSQTRSSAPTTQRRLEITALR